ncbi:transglycosylase domain-containing protein [Psychroflexus sediminis]|uniref:Penicillin-binding protein 1A n=1 Tax=Psychroflexus sediminis TaxID=470826 RepID=A0A1G7XNS5_9FLAO|nr:transglycosylase domain-containing protein [Psychroflexus sediminis]SDG85884.1 penicillin-binding protein 1A [Psychroflexus sediminis]
MSKSKPKIRKFNRIIRVSIIGISSSLLLFLLFFGSVYLGFWGKVQNKKDLANIQQSEASEILDHTGEIIDKLYKYNRQSISYSEIPKHLIQALIATEDARFYEHDGVDKYSLLRVFFKTILSGDKTSGGGSTITQQLVKNIYGRESYGIFSLPVNKLKESIVAKRIEDLYSKEEILELYLNTVPFSGNTYGIESAARLFFNKKTSELDLKESATLVGTLKANHSYNPRLFPERSQLRRDVVISQMEKYDYLTSREANKAMSEPIQLNISEKNTFQRQYFIDLVKDKAEKILSDYEKPDGTAYSIDEDGLQIYTTLDLDQQKLLENSVNNQIAHLQPLFEAEHGNTPPWKNEELLLKLAKKTKQYDSWKTQNLSSEQILDSLKTTRPIEIVKNGKSTVLQLSILDSLSHNLKQINAASLSIDPATGKILAYVGGADYRLSKFDIIENAERQVGSIFKPVVYASGLKHGLRPCDYISAKEVTYTNLDNWSPQNSSNEEKDPYLNYSLKYALTNSINTVSVKVLEKVGIQKTIRLAKSMGITSELVEQPSLALGTAELNMKELAKVYSSFANQSKVPELYFITKITSKTGETIAEFNAEPPQPSNLSPKQNRLLLAMLENVVNKGTAKRLRTTYGLTQNIAGKTGTTQNNKDGWFAAVTPKLVNISWVGHNNQSIGFKSTRLGQGANTALPIFGRLYQKMTKDSQFDSVTKAKFSKLSPQQEEAMDCVNEKRDGFFKRLFSDDDDEKKFDKKKEKEKKGFFERLFGKNKN